MLSCIYFVILFQLIILSLSNMLYSCQYDFLFACVINNSNFYIFSLGIIKDAMDCAGDLLKFICKWVLDKCADDLKFVSKRIDKAVVDRLQSIVSSSFEKIPYAEAVEILKQVYLSLISSKYGRTVIQGI